MRLFASLICFLAFAMLGAGSVHAESPTAVALHKQLKESDDHTLDLLAGRWWALIQRQPWTDTSGKFSVDAKYVSQDAEKKTVTLLASRGKGSDRVEKEITVPLGKLSKQSQARAMRIARLMPKLQEKLAEVEAKKEEGSNTRAEPQLAGAMREYADAGREGIGEVGAAELENEEMYRGPPLPPRRRPSQQELPPGDRPQNSPPAEEELNEEGHPGMNPYAGTKWIGRDMLVDDQRFKNPAVKPQPKRPEAPIDVPPDMKPDYVVDVEYVPAEFPVSDNENWHGGLDGWGELHEPFGDESLAGFHVIPVQPIAGKTTKLLFITSSVYGRPAPKMFVRIGDLAVDPESVYKSPDDGPLWAEMKLVGGKIMDLDSEEMVPLGETQENPRREQPGESYYLIGLKLPPGKTVLDIKFEMTVDYIDDFAIRLMELDVAPGEVGSE